MPPSKGESEGSSQIAVRDLLCKVGSSHPRSTENTALRRVPGAGVGAWLGEGGFSP